MKGVPDPRCSKNDSGAGGRLLEPCDLCEGEDFKLVASEDGHRIWRCLTCSLVQVRPLPPQTERENQEYWKLDLDDPAVRRARLGSRGVYSHGLNHLEEVTGASVAGKRVLDVGCGMGVFLDVAKERGAIPYGMDLSPEAVQFARKQLGIATVTVGDFESADFPLGFFQIITGWNVLEHVRSPRQWLAKASHLLADDGVLLIKVPNVRFSALASKLTSALRMLRLPTTGYIATAPPLHLYGFCTTTLRRALEAASFDVLSVERAPIRETRGLTGRAIVGLATLTSCLFAGTKEFHPVIMALARRRSGVKAACPP